MRLVLLGPPGSGKGTQGQKLALDLSVPHIATGDMIREQIAQKTEFGRMVEAAIAAGNFAPDEEMLTMICERVILDDAQPGFILDGFPRDLAQAQAYEVNSCTQDKPFDAVCELLLTQDALIERLSGRLVCPTCDEIYHRLYRPPARDGICDNDGTELVRRPDDEPAAISRRFEIYQKRTLPLREYYQIKGLLFSVDAAQSPEATHEQILKQLSVTRNLVS